MLISAKQRHSLWTRALVALLAALALIEPFLNVHFNAAGWEDEPGLRIQQIGQALQPELRWLQTDPTDATMPVLWQEATVFVPPSLDADPSANDGCLVTSLAVFLVLMVCVKAWQCNCRHHARSARVRHRAQHDPPDAWPPRWCGSSMVHLTLSPNAPPRTPSFD